jgi:hypothetical protein
MQLRELAHSRTGDKGNLITISVIAYRPESFPLLVRELTVDRVTEHFRGLVDRPVELYVLPGLSALTFVLHRPLNQGVTRSLALDAHGKCLGSAILSIELAEPVDADVRPVAGADRSRAYSEI